MATTQSIHMGPEWMRPQPPVQTPVNSQGKTPQAQPPPQNPTSNTQRYLDSLKPSAAPTASTNSERGALGFALATQATLTTGTSASGATPAIPYSSLLNAGSGHPTHKIPESLDGANQDPFRYSRDQLVSIWRNGTPGQGGPGWSLGIEVERYEGIVLDLEATPSCSRELTEAEQKVYSQGSLNSRRPSISHTLSEHRRDDHIRRGTALHGDGEAMGLAILGRRGTGDGLSLATGGKSFGNFGTNGPLSPVRERFPRRDSAQAGTTYRPRQLSVGTPGSSGDREASLPSPRAPGAFNFGGGTAFGGVLSAGEGWGGRRKAGALADVGRTTNQREKIQETDEAPELDNFGVAHEPDQGATGSITAEPEEIKEDQVENALLDNWEDDSELADVEPGEKAANADIGAIAKMPPGLDVHGANGMNGHASKQASPSPPDPATVKWCYYDDAKNLQGPFTPDQLKSWFSNGWLRLNLEMHRPDYDTGTFLLSEWQAMAATRGINPEHMFLIWHTSIASSADLLPQSPPKQEAKHIPSAPSSSVAQSEIGSPAKPPTSVFAAITSAPRPNNISLLSGSRGKPRANDADPSSVFHPLSPARIQARASTLDGSSTGSPASMNASTTDSAFGSGMGNGGVFPMNSLRSGSGAIGAIGSTGGQSISSGQSPFSTYHPVAQFPPTGRFGSDPMQSGLGYPMVGSYNGFEDPVSQRLVDPRTGVTNSYARTYDHSVVPPHQQWSHSIGTPASYGRAAATFGGRRSESPVLGVGGDVYEGSLGAPASYRVDSMGLGGAQPQVPFHQQRYASSQPNHYEQDSRRPQTLFGQYGNNQNQNPTVPILIPTAQPPAPLPIPPVVKNEEEIANRPKGPLDQELIPTILPNSPIVPLPEGPIIQKAKTQPQNVPAPIQPPRVVESNAPAPAPAPIAPTPAVVPVPVPVPALTPKPTQPITPAVEDVHPFIQVKHKKGNHNPAQAATVVSTQPTPPPVKPDTIPAIPSTTITVPLASLITPAVPSPTTAAPKAAWATPITKDENIKSLSLKEIQEAEERRVKEEARQKAAAAPNSTLVGNTAPGKSDEVEVLTWGLPTSKAGSKSSTVPTPVGPTPTGGRDTPTGGAVWATGGKIGTQAVGASVKKTMKEIQEEEERKKRKEKEANAATTAKKVTESSKAPAPAPAPPATIGGAWSTVGAGGKVTTAPTPRPTGLAALPPKPSAATVASRPSAATAPSFSAAASAGMPAPRKVTPSPAAKPAIAPSKPAEELQEPSVSADTMRWMKETLQRGLKPGSTVDVIISMVLSIQEEEFIADIIYQSSETMDGRRWAAELLSKRKADAANTSSTSGASGKPGPSSSGGSMADVLKAQPKQPAQDFGYRVVKKKGKAGRT